MTSHPALHVGIEVTREATVVTPVGVLARSTAARLRDTVTRCLADQPRIVIVDLSMLHIQARELLGVFVSASRQTAEWCAAPLVLVPGADSELDLNACGLSRFVRIYPTVVAARAASQRVARRRTEPLTLQPLPISGRVSRIFTTGMARIWGCEEILDDAELVVGELVANAVIHARTPATLRLTLHASRFVISVADGRPDPPVVPKPQATRPPAGGHGLTIVNALARPWGATRTSNGKVVWAVLRLDRSSHF